MDEHNLRDYDDNIYGIQPFRRRYKVEVKAGKVGRSFPTVVKRLPNSSTVYIVPGTLMEHTVRCNDLLTMRGRAV